MIIKRKPVGVYAANSYILSCADTSEAVVVDPGGEPEQIIKILTDEYLKLKYIVLTHAHGDHIGGVMGLKDKYDVPVLIHKADEELLNDADKNLSSQIPMQKVALKSDENLKDGDIIKFGNVELEVIHTPGHSPGCICLKSGKDIITGDTLFKASIGRTDLYGSTDEIVDSINRKLMIYEDDVNVHPGHGPESTIGYERANNPFL